MKHEAKPCTPRPYQRLMSEFALEHKRCALWAGMGMGKTLATLNVVDALHLSGEASPVLVLAPLRVARSTWPEETQKWLHTKSMEIVPIVGTPKERLQALHRNAPVFTTNYDNLEWLIEHWGDRWPYRIVVADEATRLKGLRLSYRTAKKKDGSPGKKFLAGQGAVRARALGKIAHTRIDRFIELTGTPAPNGLADLWGQMWFLDGGKRLGRTFDAFSRRWFRRGYDGYGLEPMPGAQQQIQDAVRDICLTVDPKDWFSLREPRVVDVYIDLPAKARQTYRDMERRMFAAIADRHAEALSAASRTNKCLQLANGACYVDPVADHDGDPRSKEWREVHDLKLQALESIVAENGGKPLLVVYEFRSDLARLLKAFPRGRMLRTKRDEDDFKANKIPLLFLHPASAGHGIDGFQHVTDSIVFFGQNWNLEQYQQVIERIGPVRQAQGGYDRPVTIYHILARDTVDEDVMERRTSKREIQDILLESAKRRGHHEW